MRVGPVGLRSGQVSTHNQHSSGGRTGAHIRLPPVPIVYTDFLSMYPTVNSLMGLWNFVIAERIVAEDARDLGRIDQATDSCR